MDRMEMNRKNVFLAGNDLLANDINALADNLYQSLNNFDINKLTIEATYKDYFVNHHLGKRLFFSLQNSAHIIYQSVKKLDKPVEEICFIDYGAGLGTLYMLAGMMGFKKIVYNDYLPDWQHTASAICESLGITINDYVTGDIEAVMQHATLHKIQYDIIASRNVIEHIYDLPNFYSTCHQHNPAALIFSTTTANYHNPAMRWYHRYIHYKAENTIYRKQRTDAIKAIHPSIETEKLKELAAVTRGKAQKDFTNAIAQFVKNQPVYKQPNLHTNTCDCFTGVWIEHLLSKKEHKQIVLMEGFQFEYTAGYWDTHYNSILMNLLAKALNKLIVLAGEKKGIYLSPFVNIVAH